MPRPRTATFIVLVFASLAGIVGCPAGNSPGNGAAPPTTSAGGLKRIVILTNGNSPFWDAARAGMESAERELDLKSAGFAAVLDVNDGTAAGQLAKLRQYASQSDVVAVGLSAIEAKNVAIAEVLRGLKAKGVHVVTIDSDFDPSLADVRMAYLGTNNLAGGRTLGTTARNLRPEGGQYVTFVGITGAQNAKERVQGFAEGAGDKFQSQDNMGDEMDRTRARENVRNAIRSHPDLNTLVGIWSYNAPAIVDIVRELKVRDRFTVVAFDAEPKAIQEMGEGEIDAMIVQNPYQMGYAGVRLLKALLTNDEATVKVLLPKLGEPGGDVVDTGLKVVVPDEGSPLAPEMFDPNVQFLRLAEFREWLKKYNLTGS